VGDLARDENQDRVVHHAVVVFGAPADRALLTQGQEAFLEGHVYGFERLGGIPVEQVRYDNLNSVVNQVLFGRSRQEHEPLDRDSQSLRVD
jgi:hypothetical protein